MRSLLDSFCAKYLREEWGLIVEPLDEYESLCDCLGIAEAVGQGDGGDGMFWCMEKIC